MQAKTGKLLPGIAQLAAGLFVELNGNTGFGIDDEHPVGGGIKQQPVQYLTAAHRFIIFF